MEHIFFLKGLLIGFVIAAPVGPVGVLCVNRTLSRGRLTGFVSGLGAVTGDVFYAAVAAYGIRIISSFISANSVWFSLAGGIFLAGLGIRIYLSRSQAGNVPVRSGKLAENYVSAAMVTMTNPVTLIIFGALFAALGLGTNTSVTDSTAIVVGILLGSVLCWFILSSVVDALRSSFKVSALSVFNRISGAILFGFSLVVFASIFRAG